MEWLILFFGSSWSVFDDTFNTNYSELNGQVDSELLGKLGKV